ASAPVIVLNFQDWLGERAGQAPMGRHARDGLLIGRLATCLGMFGLLFLAWPGWLHAPIGGESWDPAVERFGNHRVAWRLSPDPSQVQTALKLRALHEARRVRNAFCYSLDFPNLCAWYCPGVQFAADYRYPLFPKSAAAYALLREDLGDESLAFMEGL